MIDVRRNSGLVVAEAAYRERGGDAAASRFRHRAEDHRMAVAGDHLIGSEGREQPLEQREERGGLGAIGTGLVVVAGQEQCDRHRADVIVRRRGALADLAARPLPRRGPSGALLAEVLVDREGHAPFEAGRGQHVARVPGIGQPLHDGPEAVRDPGRRIADAVIIYEKKPHARA